MRRVLVLVMTLVLLPPAFGQPSESPPLSGRPSDTRPEVPGYAPDLGPGGLTLPSGSEQSPPPPPRTGPTIVLHGVRFEGNTVLADAELETVAAPFLNRPIGRADLEELRLRLTRFYVDKGYLNSGALLPDQEVAGGVLTYRIIEGQLGEIRVEGTGTLNPDYVSERLRIGAGPPFNVDALRERFQLLLTDPLFEQLNGRLVPGSRRGEAALELTVKRARPYDMSLSVDNYSPPSVGAERLMMSWVARNITGHGDVADLSIGFTDGRASLYGGFAVPVTPRDTVVFARFEVSDTSVVEESLDALDIETRIQGVEVGISHPLKRSLSETLALGGKLVVRDSESTLLGVPFSFSLGEEDGESKITALRLTQDYANRAPRQVMSARSTLSIGLDALNATRHHGNRPDSRYLAWLGQARFARRLLDDDRAELLLRADAQLASDALLPMERLALGGRYSVRGYRENTLVRDSGYAASAEFRYRVAQSPDWGVLHLGPFVDYGQGWNKRGPKDRETLFSLGLGLVWSWSDRVSAELFIAEDLDGAPDQTDHDLQDDGIHFRFVADLF